LKSNYVENFDLIAPIEDELNSIVNSETLIKVQSMKLFSCLNSEKPTPVFLGLARSSNASATLDSITDIDNVPIMCDDNRIEKIVQYYERIYSNNESADVRYENCIEEFLGKDILSHPVVRNSKLTDEEKNKLDMPLTVEELDKSVDKCNIRSAPGIDGLSNAFIKKFWHFLRIPIHKYALCCYNKGALTCNFSSASIRLIPKRAKNTNLKTGAPLAFFRICIK
jgi:hypothetical protein